MRGDGDRVVTPRRDEASQGAIRAHVLVNSDWLLPRKRQSAPAASDGLAQKLGHRIDCVKMRGRDIGQASQFDDRAEQRVDLGRAAVLDVLQHRGLVRADALGAGDALVDAETEADAERFADGLRFAHHRRSERAGRREAADVLERRMAQRAHGIEGEIAPELHPDFGAHVAERRRLEACSREELGQRRDALGLSAVDFGERQAMAFDVPDDSGAFDLRRLVADGGDDGVDRQMASDHAAGIDAFQPNALVRPPCL